MIDRREWIKTCIAAASAALLDTSGLPVSRPPGETSDPPDEELSSFSGSEYLTASVFVAIAKHYNLSMNEINRLNLDSIIYLFEAMRKR